MFSSEIKETIYVAIGLSLAAMVLALVAYVMGIRSDLASAQNELISTKYTMEAYTSYNKYQGAVLYGADVMAIIREFADSDIVVYIDKLTDETGGEHEFYMDKQAYINEPFKYSVEALEYGKGGSDINGGVKRNTTYYSYLVFSKYTKDEIKNAEYTDEAEGVYYSDVTGIVIKKGGNGRHNYAINQDACGCKGNEKFYGPCTATEIYNNINAIRNR